MLQKTLKEESTVYARVCVCMYVSLPSRSVSNGNQTSCLTRYLEESGIKQHNRLSQQLLESKPQAIEHLRATPTSKVSPGSEERLNCCSACSSLHSANLSEADCKDRVNVKVAGVAAFRLHASHRLAGMGLPVLQTLACTARQSVRRLRFRAFRRKQQFFSQVTRCPSAVTFCSLYMYISWPLRCIVCRELTAGDPSTVIVWGDANFRHNSRGGPPTPTKGLQRFLAPRCRFFSVDEYRSSALCSACNRRMHGLQLPGMAIFQRWNDCASSDQCQLTECPFQLCMGLDLCQICRS